MESGTTLLLSFNIKGRPLLKQETRFLIDLIEASNIINCKSTNATNNKLKTEEWIRIADRFNATADFPRTPQQLWLKWENLKKCARKRSTLIRMNQIQTGGGPAHYIPPDDVLDKVGSLLGNTVNGFNVSFGGDSQSEDCVFVDGNAKTGTSSGVADYVENETTVPIPKDKVIETVVPNYQALDVVMPNTSTRLMSSMPRAVRTKRQLDENRNSRNSAIAEYYTLKKQCQQEKLVNIKLETECLVEKKNLKLNNEKLMLEIEKLKLDLEKSKQ